MPSLPYDPSDPQSITDYASGLVEKTLREALNLKDEDSITGKGGLGTLVEKLYFQWVPETNHGPDFPEAGLELKTTGVIRKKNGDIKPKERLVLGMIDYLSVINETFETSYVKYKTDLMLILFYLYVADTSILDQRFIGKKLWKMPKADITQIKSDWDTIVNKIKDGKAHELSEGDTMYLGACTKGANATKLRKQPKSSTLAKPRAFSFKPSYVRTILEEEELRTELYGNLVNPDETPAQTFEDIALVKLSKYMGKNVNEIFNQVGQDINPASKNRFALLTNRMLGVKSKKVAEFEKAGVIVRTVRLKPNGTPDQDISFPYFKYFDIIEQIWDDSDFKNIVESKFLFIVIQEHKDGEPTFEKAVFWNMPYEDRVESQRVWEETIRLIQDGKAESLPSKKFSDVVHIRPHGQVAADTLPAPGGLDVTKKCFWFNAGYIKEQLSN